MLQNGEHIKLLFVIKSFVLSIVVAVLHRFYCNSLHIAAHMIYYLGLDVRQGTKFYSSACNYINLRVKLAFSEYSFEIFLSVYGMQL